MTEQNQLDHDQVMAESISLEHAQELVASNPAVANQICVIYDEEEQNWYGEYEDSVQRRNHAHRRTVSEAIALLTDGHRWPRSRIVIEPIQPAQESISMAKANDMANNPPILLTRQQCFDNLEELKLKHGYVWQPRLDGHYWREPLGTGRTHDKSLSIRKNVSSLLEIIGNATDVMFELVDQELAQKIASKVSIERVLGKDLVELLKLAPLNPAARARVMAAVGQMPPVEIDTWDKIKEWVEKTYQPKPTTIKPTKRETFSVPVSFSENESGTCRYIVTATGSDDYIFTMDDIQQLIVDESFENIEDLAIALRKIADENSYELEPNMVPDSDTFEYDNYECNDGDGRESRVDESTSTTEERLIRYLRTHLPVETQRRLGMVP